MEPTLMAGNTALFERRRLAFVDVEEIMPAGDRLLRGHATGGHRSSGVSRDHPARAVEPTHTTPPSDAPPTRAQQVANRLFFRAAAFPDGQSIPGAALAPAGDASPTDAAAALRGALARLVESRQPWPVHPLLGPLARGQWLSVHARRAAHHLGFVGPA